MKMLLEHIDRVKEKPHPVRRRVAFMAALSGTAVIALMWFVFTVQSGVFAIQGSSFADSMEQGAAIETVSGDSRAGLAGAAAAPALEGPMPARIEIVDTKTATSSPKAEATILPF